MTCDPEKMGGAAHGGGLQSLCRTEADLRPVPHGFAVVRPSANSLWSTCPGGMARRGTGDGVVATAAGLKGLTREGKELQFAGPRAARRPSEGVPRRCPLPSSPTCAGLTTRAPVAAREGTRGRRLMLLSGSRLGPPTHALPGGTVLAVLGRRGTSASQRLPLPPSACTSPRRELGHRIQLPIPTQQPAPLPPLSLSSPESTGFDPIRSEDRPSLPAGSASPR